jgi:hypothetical protein
MNAIAAFIGSCIRSGVVLALRKDRSCKRAARHPKIPRTLEAIKSKWSSR